MTQSKFYALRNSALERQILATRASDAIRQVAALLVELDDHNAELRRTLRAEGARIEGARWLEGDSNRLALDQFACAIGIGQKPQQSLADVVEAETRNLLGEIDRLAATGGKPGPGTWAGSQLGHGPKRTDNPFAPTN